MGSVGCRGPPGRENHWSGRRYQHYTGCGCDGLHPEMEPRSLKSWGDSYTNSHEM